MNAVIERLGREGYDLVRDSSGNPKIKNLWTPQPGGTKVPMVNIQFVKQGSGQRFELRAHTPRSFDADERTHRIYEDMRMVANRESSTFKQLDAKREAINADVPNPPGIEDFGIRASSLGDYTGSTGRTSVVEGARRIDVEHTEPIARAS